MAGRSRAEIEQNLEDSALQVVQLEKDIYELEQKREAPGPPADLDDQIRRKTDELKAAQAAWAALKAEAESSA
jgi:hypothetical protein